MLEADHAFRRADPFPRNCSTPRGWASPAAPSGNWATKLVALNYRAFAGNPFGHVDAPPFGGGPGMVLRPDVLRDALAALPARAATG